MDLRLDRQDNKELVVIRSSSCVIKIRETSSVFKSCHSDTSTSVSQETRIYQDAIPVRRVHKNETLPSYSEEDAVVARTPARASGNKQKSHSQERDSMQNPCQLPKSILKLIEPSVREVVHAHSSHHINEYDMFEVLIQVLNELKSDCKSIFGKHKSHTIAAENSVKLIIRECFTEIMARYSTDSPNSPGGNSYNRCQRIISRSIKNLTLECMDIIEKSICNTFVQAKSMRKNRLERENTKSLLIKLMQIIQTKLNTSKTVLKIVNTELHQPSFQFIFELLKYFIEKCALRFKLFCQKSVKQVLNQSSSKKGGGEVSDNSCEINISVAGQKLEEYASRLDRLLKKVSSEPLLQENPQLVIDCYHCTTKCKEQDLLLKTVSRFTEEIKQELINHARVVHEGSRYSYIGHSKGKNSRDVSLCSSEASPSQSLAWGFPVHPPHERSSSISPRSSPVRNVQSRPLPKVVDSSSKHHAVSPKQLSSSVAQQNSRSLSPPRQTPQTGISTREYKACAQHANEGGIPNNDIKPWTKCEHPTVNSRHTCPRNFHKHELPGFKCSAVLQSKSAPQSQKYNPCANLHGGTGTKQECVNKCRYCASHTPNHKHCALDTVQIEDTDKKPIPHGSIEIFQSGDSHYKLPKPPMVDKIRLGTIPESNRSVYHKIVPKEEQGLLKKSKPANDDQVKKNRYSKQDGMPSDDSKAKAQSKDAGKQQKSPDENSLQKSGSPKTEKAGKVSKPSDKSKEKKKGSIITLPEENTTAPLNEKKIPEPHVDEKEKKSDPPSSELGKENELVPGNVESKRVYETLHASNARADQESGKVKDPAHCCRMNCNCRNRRGETHNQSNDYPPRRDSMNQTDPEPQLQNTKGCKGCNCGQSSIPVFMNGCTCKTGGAQEGNIAVRPIYQFFANPVSVPCNCTETPNNKEQKEAQTSKPTTPKSERKVSQETGTQTSKNQFKQLPSESEPSSYAPSSSAPSKHPSSSAPSNGATSTQPSGYTPSSGSERSYIKYSTTQPTSSTASRIGKSDSVVSCTCSIDKGASQSTDTRTSKPNVKDACTSDTNCCCPEKIEEVFQEFDDKYSQVVKEIKFLIKEGYIPLNKEETHEITVTASRSTPRGTSSKTTTCRCTPDSCKRCKGNPAAAFSRNPQMQSVNPQKGQSNNYNLGNECEEGFRSANKPPKKQMKYDITYDECEEPPPPPQYASKDTFVYNELQKDILDLKELVKNTRFGNCPCCKCCKCEPESNGHPCTKTTDSMSNNTPQDGTKNVSKPAPGSTAEKDSEKGKTSPDKKSEPYMSQPNEKQKATYQPDKRSEPVRQSSNNQTNEKRESSSCSQPDQKSETSVSHAAEKNKTSTDNQPGKRTETSVSQPNEKRQSFSHNQIDKKSEPSLRQTADKQKTFPENQPDQDSEPSMSQPKNNAPTGNSEPGDKNYSYYGSAPANAWQRMTVPQVPHEKEQTTNPTPTRKHAVKRDSIKADDQLEQSVSPQAVDKDGKNVDGKNVKHVSDSVHQYTAGAESSPQDADGKVPPSSEADLDQSEGRGREKESPRGLSIPSNKQDGSNQSGVKGAGSRNPLIGSEDAVLPGSANGRSAPANITKKGMSTDDETGASGSQSLGMGPNGTNPSDSSEKSLSPNGPTQIPSSSILKEHSKDKIDSKSTPKKVEIDEPPSTGTAGTSNEFSDVQGTIMGEDGFGEARKPQQVGSDPLPQKTVSNVSFGSRKSTRSTTSSKNLVLSPEQEALFQSRERLRDYSSQVFIAPEDSTRGTGRDTTERQYAVADEPEKPAAASEDDQRGFFHKIFGGNSKTSATIKATPAKDSSSDDSVDESSSDSTVDICRTLLDNMELMPCRFWSKDEATPSCQDLETYIMVLESETSDDRATVTDETFIFSNNKPTRAANKAQNPNFDKEKLKKRKEAENKTKSLIHKTSFLASKGTNTVWRGITSPIGIVRGLCKRPSPLALSKPSEISREILKRELSKSLTKRPAKKLVLPLNVSSHYSHIRCGMPKSRDRKRLSGGDLRTYSSESFKRNCVKPRKTENKEVQVTKWNAMTQTAGPRKFNRTDISKDIEDKLARYLGLERTVEEMNFSRNFSSHPEDRTDAKRSTLKSTILNRESNRKKRTKTVK